MKFISKKMKMRSKIRKCLCQHCTENNILEIENNNWMHRSAANTSTWNIELSTLIKPTTTFHSTPTTTLQYPKSTHRTPSNEENALNENETISEDNNVIADKEISNEILQKNESSQTQPPMFTEKLNKGNVVIDQLPIEQSDQRVKPTPPTTYDNKIYKENSVIKSNYIMGNWDDEADYSYEDFAVEYNGRTVVRQNKIRNHTSYQTSVFKRPLLQGFLATTGYPKFYIGESNCSWRISAPIGQRVRISVLDINLRYDFICKDFIQIFDLEIGRMLFNSCSEHARPIQVLSDSNHILISVDTTSMVAYPKRGVLLHYTETIEFILEVSSQRALSGIEIFFLDNSAKEVIFSLRSSLQTISAMKVVAEWKGYTPLHLAMRFGKDNIFELLCNVYKLLLFLNVRALMCSMHTVLWADAKWVKCEMHQLLSAADVKKQYRKACLAVHPDKQMGTENENSAKLIFMELNNACTDFENDASAEYVRLVNAI